MYPRPQQRQILKILYDTNGRIEIGIFIDSMPFSNPIQYNCSERKDRVKLSLGNF